MRLIFEILMQIKERWLNTVSQLLTIISTSALSKESYMHLYYNIYFLFTGLNMLQTRDSAGRESLQSSLFLVPISVSE